MDKNKSPSPKRQRSRSAEREQSRDGRKRRSRSRERRKRSLSRSKSRSPFRGNYRGGQRGRFNRRSPDRFRFGTRNFRDREFNNRRSRSRSFGRRNRRSRSDSPPRQNNYTQQQDQTAPMYSDGYGNFMPNIPAPPQFNSMMAPQFNNYDFQASSYPPAPSFNSMGIACPVPPGMSEAWIPPPTMSSGPIQPEETEEEKLKREAAVAEEKKRQREGLKKQRDQYVTRSEKMKNELKVLKQQKSNLMDGLGKRSPSPKTGAFIKENDKLQSQISSKLSEILNVIDMLTGIIGKEEETPKKNKSIKKAKKSESDDSSPERIKTELLESMKRKREAEEKKQKFNYTVYDPEEHWCKSCQVFPKAAKDYLSHLHSKEHAEKTTKKQTEAPWKESFMKANEIPNYPGAATKQRPIKGLQFFEPVPMAWWCKLCQVFMGDLQCASHHLKSEIHSEKYSKFVEAEPEFETKWTELREKAQRLAKSNSGKDPIDLNGKALTTDKSSNKDDKKSKKKKAKRDDHKDKKKRKSGKKRKRTGSSSSSSSDTGDSDSSNSETSSKKDDKGDPKMNSIRVAMRNYLSGKSGSVNDDSAKWTKLSDKPTAPPAPSISKASKDRKKDDPMLGQWTSVAPIISPQEKQLLENLKGRLKGQPKSEPLKKDEDKEKPRERERSKERTRVERNYRPRRSRSQSPVRNRRSRSNSRSRNRRSRSRSRGRYGRRYSRDSRSPERRVEKPRVNFPPEPRPPPVREKLPARSYTSSKKDESKKDEGSSTSNHAKKMPFIGKMPVFKKQLSDKKSEEQIEEKKSEMPIVESNSDHKEKEDPAAWDDLMPDPYQYSAIMGAPPPPPRIVIEEQPEMLPPGIDESEADLVMKPISDAPIARKGPLPEDFQATLDLLFDGDTPKPVVIEPKPVPEVVLEPISIPNDGPQMIMPEELSQHALLYGNFYGQNSDIPPLPVDDKLQPTKSAMAEMDVEDASKKVSDAIDKAKKAQEMELDDLALLGIDVNDVGSGMW